MAACLLRPYPPGLPPSRADSNPASHQPTRLRWGLGRRRRRRHILRCVAASTATLQRELVLPSPRTEQSPGPANPRNLFDRMPDRSVATVPGAANLLDKRPRTKGKGSEEQNRSGAPKGGEKSRSGAVVALAHAGRHEELVEHFRRMRGEGVPASRFVLPSVFRACARLQDSRMLRAVHGLVIKCSLCQHVVVGTALIDAYVDFGFLDDAKKVFNEIREPNAVSWSVIIGGYARFSQWDEAWVALLAMQHSGVLPNVSVLVMAIQASGALGCLVRGKQMHAMAVVLGFGMNATVWNCLIDMYGKCGSMESCKGVFDTMIGRDQVSWNTIVSRYVRLGLCEEALDMIVRMQESGFTTDRFTLGSGVAACAHLGDTYSGRAFHGHLIRRALDTDVIRGTALVDMYGKSGNMELARLVFDRMDERNYVSWDALLSGYVENGLVDSALDTFRKMESANIKPNQHTFANLLRLCGDRRYKEYGRQIHGHAIKVINQMNVVLETELIDMYAKCGCIEVSRLLFLRMNERNLISWNTLLSGYVGDRQSVATINIYRQMELACVRPDLYTLAGLLNLCRFQGLLHYGRQIHARLIKTGSEMNVVLQTLLVHMYFKCRRWRDARNVCTLIRERNSHVYEAFFKVYGDDYLI
ncbi:putative pentatricopeptide repeat-containing protein [Panicum miliaceum]|uniref:Pentatricopeptide repeat-containing protein n=1 Tax=Panicum miliaceum TaxID=4540 RepID=A0A3L6RV16_PANMI|nr:putative pentatricopeptide repeat-containing protein [Panicum miliaceum]